MINDSSAPMTLDGETVITTFNNYGTVWALYIGLTLLLAGLVWFAFRKQHFLLKWLLSSIVLAGALCFGHPADNVDTYSPLILNTMVELFDGNNAQFMSDLKFIAAMWGILFVAGVLVWLLIRYIRKDKTPKAQKSSNKKNTRIAKEPTEKQADKEKPMASKEKTTPIEPTIGDVL